ncbi:DsbA family protein [Neobacillus vireti]|uniref:Thiol-disulfide oxidoreductase BdbD n=1 Tax=Neobacillus vireti LMG 21834 TaxID=1131730 RepID=A0AB94IKG7_9BACI|nr:DsbA family protein [Neobacillus vireti]ETI67530.1 thiol-disulfide oxidoreductase BdbD [Neobacillus vireti LMG 21834]KLT18511.1 thiol-disulfide oxidoreductase [Neobacillus vireti]
MAKNNKKTKKQPQSSSKFVFWMIGIIAVFVLGFIFLGNHTKPEEKQKTEETIDYSNQPFLGDESAPVSIIEFGDYKCPNCKHFAENIVPIIQQELVDTGKAKFYFMNDSFINIDSIRSAKFAESVYQELGNETFWKFHDRLFDKQPEDSAEEKKDVFTESFLIDTLKEVASDKDAAKVVQNFQAKKSDDAWQKDMDYAEKLGVTGTPTMFVNGKMFTGTKIDHLIKMVEEAAKEKKNE